MKLSTLITDYLAYRRALGNRFIVEGFILRSFSRHLGSPELDDIDGERVHSFLFQRCTTLDTTARKRRALAGLYRYALTRRHRALPPLPVLPRVPQSSFVPYIYSRHDLRGLLDAAQKICAVRPSLIEDYALQALLLTLYGAGLRLGEALALNCADVDLQEAVITVRDTKFFKTRLVPIGQGLVRVLAAYRSRRELRHRGPPGAPFFRLRNGAPMNKHVVERTFCRLRAAASVQRDGGPRQQPRLHDLRHTAAVHRLLRWYKDGDDLQQQLPRLATYLGHKDLSATQRYLTLTPQLLRAASQRFEHYAMENHYE